MNPTASIIVVLLGSMLVTSVQRGRPSDETRIAWLGYLGHLVGAGAQYMITAYWYGGGDMFMYALTGEQLDRLLDYDFGHYSIDIARLFFHEDVLFPVTVVGVGSSTGTMAAIAAVVLYPLGGSLVAACLLLSTAAFLSRIVLLRVFLKELPPENHRAVTRVMLLLPSVTFWGAALAKETVVLIGLGPLALSAHALTSRGSPLLRAGLLLIGLLAGGLIWLVKPYIVVGFVTAGMVWWYTRLLKGRSRPVSRVQLVLGGILAVAAVAVVGQVLPNYSAEAIAEQASHLQTVGEMVDGGSNYQIGSIGARSGIGQAAFVPIALAYALFRPFIFESRNPLMLLNSLETTWVTYLVVMNLSKGRFSGLISAARESPIAAFSLAFVFVVGIGVGLTTTNLGTLTRYRMPMMPFYAVFLVVWQQRLRAQVTTPTSPALPTQPRRRRRFAPSLRPSV